jgi:H+/Cl- antiporter ClcA
MNSYKLFVIIIASCIFGIAGKYFSILIHTLKRFYTKIFENYMLRAFIASIIILILMLAFNLNKYAGLSTWMIDAGFDGKVNLIDSFVKFLLTCLTLGAGFQGGEVTPLFDIGASLGGLIGQFTNIEPSFLAALGLISVFGCAANTPITTIMLGIEMFGTSATQYYIIAALISYYITGHNGIYNSQIIYTPKFRYLNEHSEKSIEEIKTVNEIINDENDQKS